MAQCPVPLATSKDLAENYNVLGVTYSQKAHVTHRSSPRNAVYRNMIDAGNWEINLRPAEAQLQILRPKGHKSDRSTVPTQRKVMSPSMLNSSFLLLSLTCCAVPIPDSSSTRNPKTRNKDS